MRLKKFLSILLVLTMILSIIPIQVIASTYNDTKSHWAEEEISKWSNLDVIKGSDGLFRPSESITRGEMAVIVDRIMKYQVKASNDFVDLDSSWYTDAILRANKAGIILGSNGKVRPQENITREEAVVMISRALSIKESSQNANFSDMNNVSEWAKGYVNTLSFNKIISGIGNNIFAPNANITRAEVVKIFDNAIKGFYNMAGEYSENANGDVIINTPNVTLKDMEIKGNLIISEGVGEGEVTLDNIKIKGNTIVKGGGENSIYFNNVTVDGALIVNKVGGNLRIVVTGTSNVSVAILESGAILITKDIIGGGIEKVVIPANIVDAQNIVLQGIFNIVENNATNLNLKATGKIERLILNEKTTLTGGATVNNVTTAPLADSVINGKSISGGQSNMPISDNKNNTSSGGSSGSGDTNIKITGVTLNKTNITLQVGAKETLIAKISPANATNKNVTWTSDKPLIATVTGGAISAVATGTAIITVTTEDGGMFATCNVLVKEPQTLIEAKKSVESAIVSLSVSNETIAENIMNTIKSAITNEKIKAIWDVPFSKVNASFDSDGTISGTISLTLEGENPIKISILKTIAKLSTTTYTVTFDSNGGSAVESITGIVSGSRITLPQEPTKESLSFIGWYIDENLQNKFNENDPITSNITLYAKWSGWQAPIEIDRRFAPGYPMSNISDGKIQIKVKLTSPAEVYMVVNQINSENDITDSTAVIHGHSGTEDDIIYIEEAPYINITDTNEHIINTNVTISGEDEVKIYFVVKDNIETSATPTLVEYTAEAVTELDNSAPQFNNAYINSAKDKISIYFYEGLDTSYVPSINDFTLSNGTITEVKVSNYDNRNYGRVELTVSGITDNIGLTVSYNGDTLRDAATVPNKVKEIIEEPVEEATVSIPNENVFVSNNGQYIRIKANKVLLFESQKWFDLVLKYGSTFENATELNKDTDYSFTYSWRTDGSSMDIYIKLNNVTLVDGSKYFITFKPNGLKDLSGDTVNNIDVHGIPSEIKESNVVPLSANYNLSEKVLTINFMGDYGLEGNTYGCFFKLSDGNKVYTLRGRAWFDEQSSELFVEEDFSFIPKTFDWENAKISYSLDIHPEASVHDIITFISGMPYEGFADVAITVNP